MLQVIILSLALSVPAFAVDQDCSAIAKDAAVAAMNSALQKGWHVNINTTYSKPVVKLIRSENRYVNTAMGEAPELSKVYIYDVKVPDNGADIFNYRAVVNDDDCILVNLFLLGERRTNL